VSAINGNRYTQQEFSVSKVSKESVPFQQAGVTVRFLTSGCDVTNDSIGHLESDKKFNFDCSWESDSLRLQLRLRNPGDELAVH